ncbi:hypothetical protein ABXS71_20135 [Bacillus infantis]|uniref:hypothetical protein n=1 Tax=Bacillus infantis TaxID=324767 RepID=UPI00344C6642
MDKKLERKKASRRFRQEAFFLMKNQRAGYTSPNDSHNFRCPCQPHGTELKVPVFNWLLLLQKNRGMSNGGGVVRSWQILESYLKMDFPQNI